MKKAVFLVVTILLMGLTGCAHVEPSVEGASVEETVYDVTDISVIADYHNSIKEYTFTYVEDTKQTEETGKQYIDSPNKEETDSKVYFMDSFAADPDTQMKHVLSARTSKYGYRNCYVVDGQHNEYLYLTDEAIEMQP